MVLEFIKACEWLFRKNLTTASTRRVPPLGEDEVYDHSHAEGFIRLYSLPSRIRALSKKKIR